MKQEMINIPKKEYLELLDEVGILRDPEIMAAIKENEREKRKGVKTWEIKF